MKPFNALFDEFPKDFSTNQRAEEIMGRRSTGIPIDMPCELGYICPVCKYETIINGTYDERLQWSEYNGFLWCAVCNKDYPSALCHPDINESIKIYLDSVEDAIERKLIKE